MWTDTSLEDFSGDFPSGVRHEWVAPIPIPIPNSIPNSIDIDSDSDSGSPSIASTPKIDEIDDIEVLDEMYEQDIDIEVEVEVDDLVVVPTKEKSIGSTAPDGINGINPNGRYLEPVDLGRVSLKAHSSEYLSSFDDDGGDDEDLELDISVTHAGGLLVQVPRVIVAGEETRVSTESESNSESRSRSGSRSKSKSKIEVYGFVCVLY